MCRRGDPGQDNNNNENHRSTMGRGDGLARDEQTQYMWHHVLLSMYGKAITNEYEEEYLLRELQQTEQDECTSVDRCSFMLEKPNMTRQCMSHNGQPGEAKRSVLGDRSRYLASMVDLSSLKHLWGFVVN